MRQTFGTLHRHNGCRARVGWSLGRCRATWTPQGRSWALHKLHNSDPTQSPSYKKIGIETRNKTLGFKLSHLRRSGSRGSVAMLSNLKSSSRKSESGTSANSLAFLTALGHHDLRAPKQNHQLSDGIIIPCSDTCSSYLSLTEQPPSFAAHQRCDSESPDPVWDSQSKSWEGLSSLSLCMACHLKSGATNKTTQAQWHQVSPYHGDNKSTHVTPMRTLLYHTNVLKLYMDVTCCFNIGCEIKRYSKRSHHKKYNSSSFSRATTHGPFPVHSFLWGEAAHRWIQA